MFQDVASLLSRMGLNENDIFVFMALLPKREGLFVHEIVKTSQLNRSTAYLAIDRLLEGGFISKSRTGNRWKYYAEPPETLVSKQEHLLEDLKVIAPMLSRLKDNQGTTEIRFYEGIKGVQRGFDTLVSIMKFNDINTHEGHSVSFSSTQSRKAFQNWDKKYIPKRMRLGRWYRAIAPESARHISPFTNDPSLLREMKYIPDDKFPFKVCVEVIGDLTFIYTTVHPIGGITIRNLPIADSMRALWKFIWDILPDEPIVPPLAKKAK